MFEISIGSIYMTRAKGICGGTQPFKFLVQGEDTTRISGVWNNKSSIVLNKAEIISMAEIGNTTKGLILTPDRVVLQVGSWFQINDIVDLTSELWYLLGKQLIVTGIDFQLFAVTCIDANNCNGGVYTVFLDKLKTVRRLR